MSKEKTARIIPNAVGIKTEDSKVKMDRLLVDGSLTFIDFKAYLFGSLLSRDNTYQILQCVVNKTAPKV